MQTVVNTEYMSTHNTSSGIFMSTLEYKIL